MSHAGRAERHPNERWLQVVFAAAICAASADSQSLFKPNPFAAVPQPDTRFFQMVVADVTGDGYPDAITGDVGVLTGGSVELRVFPGAGSSVFGAPIVSTLAPGASGFGAGVLPIAAIDVNGDGWLDIVSLRNSGSAGNYPQGLSVLVNQGGGSFVAGPVGPTIPLVLPLYENFAAADLDGDGGCDVACAGMTVPPYLPYELKVYSTSSIGFAFAETFNQTMNYQINCLSLFDMNGDGLKDIVYQRFNAGSPAQLVVLLRTVAGGFSPEIVSYWPPQAGPLFGPSQLVIGDVNSDGIPDLVGFGYGNYGPPGPGEVVTMLGNGTGALTPGGIYVTGVPANQFVAPQYGYASLGDFDHDGVIELQVLGKIVRLSPAYGGGNVNALDNSQFVGTVWGEHAADVDLDGDLDIVQAGSVTDSAGYAHLRLGVAINRTAEGLGCGGPTVTTGTPAPGNPAFAMGVTGGPSNATAALGLSFSEGFNPLGPCVVRLNLAPGQLIFPTGSLGIMTTNGGGSVQAVVSIPNDPTLLGTDYFVQWIVADPAGPVSVGGMNYALTGSRRILLW